MQEKVREYIKDYYNNNISEFNDLRKCKIIKLFINEKVVKLADLLKFCTSYLPEDARYSERLYNVLNNLYNIPICPTCNTNICKFNRFNDGYYKTCSRKCNSNNIITREKIKNTSIQRYGVENYSQTKEYKEKTRQTCIEKFGTEHQLQNKDIKEKSKQSCLKKYGKEYIFQTDLFKNKTKQTCLNKYGSEFYSQTDEYKEKSKQSCLEKYGKEHTFQVEEFREKSRQTLLERYEVDNPLKNEVIKNKAKQTCIERYGADNPLKNKEIQEKRKQTCLLRHGVEHPFQSKLIYNITRLNYKNNKFDKLLNDTERLNNCTPLFNVEEFKQNKMHSSYKWKWSCNTCNTIFYDDLYHGSSPVCPKCYKQYRSNLQKEIYEFIYNNITNNIHLNDRSIGIEIDLYLKDYNLGIEVNGNYWHSDLHGKDKYYHLNKTIEAGKSGISLLHIFEDDWLYKKDIIKNLILDKLGVITNAVDNLSIYKITNDMSAEFLNNNCINGNINQDNIIHYGLCTQDDIYYLISIQDNKIIRYCSKLGYKVDYKDISKLISRICQENNLDTLIVYCDLRYDTGELFKELNFNYLKFKHPTYDYINKKNYQSRIDKDNLIFESYDDKLSTWYNAINNNYDRIWNCGYIIYEYQS